MKCLSKFLLSLIAVTALLCSCVEEEYLLNIYATNDLHGEYFSLPYSESGKTHISLSNLSYAIKTKRVERESFMLLDIGDNLQGDNAAYFANYKDTLSQRHLFCRITEYIGYDAVVVGNHDIETGHSVYDRIKDDGAVPFLAANAIDVNSGKPYFKPYTIVRRGGLKVAVIGMTNPYISHWLAKEVWEGIEFLPIYPYADSLVNAVRKEEEPDLVVLAVHSGIGKGEESDVENSAMLAASKIKGVDIVFAGHDHRVYVGKSYNGADSVLVLEGGDKVKNVACAQIILNKRGGKVVSKRLSGRIISLKDVPMDEEYNSFFEQDFLKVKEFSNAKVGTLIQDLSFSDALKGNSDYMKFIHYVQLQATGADISISAPLNTKGTLRKGDLRYSNLFDLYRFENSLYLVKMSGRELKEYLEASYHSWVNGIGPAYNYDSAAGIIYKVKKSAEKGSRVCIESMADGTPFLLDKEYSVAMNSYRSSGAGGLLEAAGLDQSDMDKRIVGKYQEVRDLIYKYINDKGCIDVSAISAENRIGNWNFVK